MVAVGLALVPTLPYGYYSVMRWVVCALCVWLSLASYRSEREAWTWIWGIIAGIYNPIFPLHANREVWSVVNVATISVSAWYGLKVIQSNRGQKNGGKN